MGAALVFMSIELLNLLFLLLLPLMVHHAVAAGSKPLDPIQGFVEVPLSNSNFHNLKPYDLPASKRYSFKNGVHDFWVYSTDNPLANGSPTHPRSELRIEGYYYNTGVWQFEGYAYVPSGTSGVCIMQVFGAKTHATTLMLKVNNGTLTYYLSNVLEENIYDRWFRVNVIHDADTAVTRTFIDGILRHEAPHRQNATHHFQFGVYQQENASFYAKSRWKGIRILKRPDEDDDNSQKVASKKNNTSRKFL
ncbi:citrate-binding protein-like [Malania oleifera]|uniref:citrate-binding protein-like n=1 Tax=Malania oleifera TaxID=397392 RepID=UPI0025AE8C1D|nr:citrate-binding protein-like [Malania oleifera]